MYVEPVLGSKLSVRLWEKFKIYPMSGWKQVRSYRGECGV